MIDLNNFVFQVIDFTCIPKLYEYLGIYSYSNELEPMHVHAKKTEFESKAEFYIVDGIISEIKIVEVKGKMPLNSTDLKNFEKFLENYSNQIVQKWIDYFIYHREIAFERITKKL
jgi:hypothetical protein